MKIKEADKMRSKSNLQASQSAASSSSSGTMGGRVATIPPPKICWCGHTVVELKSRRNRNPGRMYYRCSYAADNRLMNDDHIFKWVDEVSCDLKPKTLEEELLQMKQTMSESIEYERKKLEQMGIEVEERLIERIEVEILDAKRGIWKALCILVIVGLVIMVGFAKLFG